MPNATPAPPLQTDVDALRHLLDITDRFDSNDQRARYLLTSNWFRGRGTPTSDTPAARCPDHAWCTLTTEASEHRDFHVSRTIDLVPARDGGEAAAVSAWVTQDRGHGEQPRLVVDGRTAAGTFDSEVSARGAYLLLAAIVEAPAASPLPPAGETVLQLLDEAVHGGSEGAR